MYGLTFHLATYERPDNYVGEIVTTTARLTRAVPPGEDEALWKRMTAAMDGRWADDSLCNSNSGATILREILQIHPASAYYPYAVVLARELDLRPTLFLLESLGCQLEEPRPQLLELVRGSADRSADQRKALRSLLMNPSSASW